MQCSIVGLTNVELSASPITLRSHRRLSGCMPPWVVMTMGQKMRSRRRLHSAHCADFVLNPCSMARPPSAPSYLTVTSVTYCPERMSGRALFLMVMIRGSVDAGIPTVARLSTMAVITASWRCMRCPPTSLEHVRMCWFEAVAPHTHFVVGVYTCSISRCRMYSSMARSDSRMDVSNRTREADELDAEASSADSKPESVCLRESTVVWAISSPRFF